MILSLLRSEWSQFILWFLVPVSVFSRFLRSVPRAPTTIGITIIFMFLNFFRFLERSQYLLSFRFHLSFLWFAGSTKSIRWQVLFFLLIRTRFGLLAGILEFFFFLYFKIAESLIIFNNKFWFMHLLFVSMAKCLSLAQFPVDNTTNCTS